MLRDYSARGLASSAFDDWLSYVGYGRERGCRRDIAASRKNLKGLREMIVIAAVLYGVGSFVLALSHALSISLIIALVLGFSLVMQMASSNTIVQSIVEDRKRGRVLSVFVMGWRGIEAFGSLLSAPSLRGGNARHSDACRHSLPSCGGFRH